MITILRILLLWISLFGIFLFVHNKFKVKKEFAMPITFLSIILILFVASLLNILKLCSLLIFLFGLGYLAYLFIRKKISIDFIKKSFDYKTILVLVLIIFVSIISYRLTFTSYDNFSHWALIVKQLFLHDTLPSFQYSVDEFTTYPPASALFIYFVGLIAGKSEYAMIMGQSYLLIGIVSALTVLFKDKNKIICSILYIVFNLYLFVCNVLISDLLVDTLLGAFGILSVVLAYYYRDNLKKACIYLGILSCVFIILKNSGFLFIGLNILLILLIGIRNKKLKLACGYSAVILLCVAAIFYLWQQHLLLVYYGDTGQITKHSISITNAVRNITSNGYEESLTIVIAYLNNFINLNSLINWYIIGINLALIILICLYKERRKDIFKVLILCDILYLGYWAVYGLLYVLSMPYEEAVALASYNRYLMSCIIVLLGILLVLLFEICDDKKGTIILIITILIFSFLIFENKMNKPGPLIGIDSYENSERQQIQNIIKEYDFNKYPNNEIVLLMDCSLSSYSTYVLRYELYRHNVQTTCNNISDSKLKEETIIIIPTENKNLVKQLDKFNTKKIDENTYEIVS